MTETVRDTQAMIAGMTPVLTEGSFVFCSIPEDQAAENLVSQARAIFAEDEGLSLILAKDLAAKEGFDVSMPMRQISLHVYSSLDGVGLTAAVAGRLTELGIPCNMVAAIHHDHVFVPSSQANKALQALKELQAEAATKG